MRTLEQRMGKWVISRIGTEHMHPKERAMRLLEEAMELAQAEGISIEQVSRQAEHVYSRPVGSPRSEASGVAVCLLAWCCATGNLLRDLALDELKRIERKPIEHIRGSLARKYDSDLITTVKAAEK